MTSIEHRENTVVIPDEALLPSQRALFALEAPYRPSLFHGLSPHAVKTLGNLLKTVVIQAEDDYLTEILLAQKNEAGVRSSHDTRVRSLSLLGDVLENDTPTAPLDEDEIERSLHVSATVQDGFDSSARYERIRRATFKPITWDHQPRYFTPCGYVKNPIGEFRQKVVAIDIEYKHLITNPGVYYSDHNGIFNFGSQGHLYLYTDNASAELPAWQYSESSADMNDIFPENHPNPYFFHAAPPRFTSEELALSSIKAVANVLSTSSKEYLAQRTTAE